VPTTKRASNPKDAVARAPTTKFPTPGIFSSDVKSRIQFWCKPDSDWNHWPGKRSFIGVPVVVWTPPKGR